MSKIATFLKALVCVLFSLTAPFVMVVAVWFVKKDDTKLPSVLGFYRTPDEANLVGLYEPAIKAVWDRCWRCAVFMWYGVRNRAHGIQHYFAKPCAAWPENRLGTVSYGNGLWLQKKQLSSNIQFSFGWAVYADKEGVPTEARPVLSLKWRSV